MQTQSSQGPAGIYVLTSSIANRLQAFRSNGLVVPERDDPVFRSFHKKFVAKVEEAIPGTVIHVIDAFDLMKVVSERVSRIVAEESGTVSVCTCADIASILAGEEFHFNRLFDEAGDLLGYGPRPGHGSLGLQLVELSRRVAGRKVVLVEDGSFTGSTICRALELLDRAGMSVAKIVVGFCSLRAETAVRRVFDGEVIIVEKIPRLVDWIPDHDLMPFIPYSGRVMGKWRADDGALVPSITDDGRSLAFPYIYPFGKLDEWATMAPDGARTLSAFCLDAGAVLFDCIAKRSGKKKLVIGDLMCGAKVSLPVSIGKHHIRPSLDMSVVDFLRLKREEIG